KGRLVGERTELGGIPVWRAGQSGVLVAFRREHLNPGPAKALLPGDRLGAPRPEDRRGPRLPDIRIPVQLADKLALAGGLMDHGQLQRVGRLVTTKGFKPQLPDLLLRLPEGQPDLSRLKPA